MNEQLKNELREKLKKFEPIFDDNNMSLDTALTLVNSMFCNATKELDKNSRNVEKLREIETYRNEIKMLYSGKNRNKIFKKIKTVYSPILLERNKK